MKRKTNQWNSYRDCMSANFFTLLFLLFAILSLIAIFTFPDKIENNEKVEASTIIQINIDTIDWILSIDYIKESEAFKSTPYLLDGNWFIGYGHLITDKESFDTITEQQAVQIMENDLLQCIRYASIRYDLIGNQSLAVGMLFYGTNHSVIFKSQLHTELCKGPDEWNEEIIKDSWISFCLFNGKQHQKIKTRRQFELNLFLKK